MRYCYIIALLLFLHCNAQEKLFEVDGYPVTDKMIRDNYGKDNNRKNVGDVFSLEKVWFGNKAIGQTLIFELYTDGHRFITWHFYNNDIPAALAETIEMHLESGELAENKQVAAALPKFTKIAVSIPENYFETLKGLGLGDTKEKALAIYNSKPDNITNTNGVEKYEWSFVGDISISEGYSKADGKPVARDSFGHNVTLFFREEKLIGIILLNDIP